jgi:hypothetical protein
MTKIQKRLNSLRHSVSYANACRNRIEILYSKNKLTRSDLDYIYKGLFINSIVSFENFIEDIFIGFATNQYAISGVKPTIKATTRFVVKNIVAGGKNKYCNWLPFNKTQELANIYFVGGRPFNKIQGADRKTLDLLIKIRNYFAHGSDASKDFYIKQLSAQYCVLQPYYKPVNFLRDYYSYPTKTT